MTLNMRMTDDNYLTFEKRNGKCKQVIKSEYNNITTFSRDNRCNITFDADEMLELINWLQRVIK